MLKERRSQADWGAPWIVARVADGTNPVAGTVDLWASVFDDYFSPTQLVFAVDGSTVGTATTLYGSPKVSFDTTKLFDGTHTLTVLGSDASGHAAAAKPVSFVTRNFTATAPPVVSITYPTQGQALTGTTYVSASVTGAPTNIRQLLLSIDGQPAAISVDSPYLSFQWDVSKVSAGSHTLVATAIDTSENVGTSSTVTVTTSTGTTPARAPTIILPTDGSAVGPYFTLTWTGEGAGGSQGGGSSPDVSLVLDNVVVSPNPLAGKSGAALIDARLWTLGPHQLRLRLGTADSAPVVVVRQQPTTPAAFIASPRAWQVVRGVVQVAVVASDDAPISSVVLRADGATVGSVSGGSGNIAFDTAGKPKQMVLEAEATSSDGGKAKSEQVTVRIDNGAPTVAIGYPAQNGIVSPGILGVRVVVSDAETFIAQIGLTLDGSALPPSSGTSFLLDVTAGAHTLVATATDAAGNQATSAPTTFTAASCSTTGCDDGSSCTSDSCASTGRCVHAKTANCCTGPADCADADACTTDTCAGGACVHATIAGCCNSAFTCDDADLCTKDLCSGAGGTCSHSPASCCAADADCSDGKTCTTDRCIGAPAGFCAHDWTPDCCTADADCDDGDVCTSDHCGGGVCSHAAVAGCCVSSATCADSDPCTSDLCANNVCTHTPTKGCCATDPDCTTLNPCSRGTCSQGHCSFAAVSGCCNFDFECADSDPCTVHGCVGNVCTLVSATAGCADAGVASPDAAAPGPDAAAPGLDAAAPGPDAAAAGLDASAPGLDAGAPGLDAAVPPGPDAAEPASDAAASGTDTGTAELDAAIAAVDAETPAGPDAEIVPGEDAGSALPLDASTVVTADTGAPLGPDAEVVHPSDAAQPSADGAVVNPGADASDPNEVITSGCGCASGAGGTPSALPFALAAMLLLSRRRSGR
ncbi:MAG: Ig-like domain-containing protein [Myxococcales bacterium]